MRHADLKKKLPDYLEGELPLETRALVDAHLDDCRDCAREVEEMRQTIRLLRELPDPEPPPMIAANVMRRIRAGEARPGFFDRVTAALGGILEPGFVLPASAIAAAALVVTVVQGPSPVLVDGDEIDAAVGLGTGRSGTSTALPLRADRPKGRSWTMTMDFSPVPPSMASRPEGQAPGSPPGAGWLAARESAGIPSGLRTRPEAVRPSPSAMSFGPLLTPRAPRSADPWSGGPSNGVMRREGSLASSGTLVVAERFGSGPFAEGLGLGAERPPLSSPQAIMQGMMAQGGPYPAEGSTGARDPRDAWLLRGLENPVEFARYIAGQNLAEQELWVSRLTERAEARGLMADFLRALRASGDPTAAWVADDFAAEARRAGEASSIPDDSFER